MSVRDFFLRIIQRQYKGVNKTLNNFTQLLTLLKFEQGKMQAIKTSGVRGLTRVMEAQKAFEKHLRAYKTTGRGQTLVHVEKTLKGYLNECFAYQQGVIQNF